MSFSLCLPFFLWFRPPIHLSLPPCPFPLAPSPFPCPLYFPSFSVPSLNLLLTSSPTPSFFRTVYCLLALLFFACDSRIRVPCTHIPDHSVYHTIKTTSERKPLTKNPFPFPFSFFFSFHLTFFPFLSFSPLPSLSLCLPHFWRYRFWSRVRTLPPAGYQCIRSKD